MSSPNQKNNPVKNNRYIVVLKDNSPQSVAQAEQNMSKRLVSSQQLNVNTNALSLMSTDTGIVYKNLGIAVVDDIDEGTLSSLSTPSDGPILYWEREREFYPMDQLDQLAKLKNTVSLLQDQIDELETSMRSEQEKNVLLGWERAAWGIRAINLQENAYTGNGVRIACLDTGFYLDHPDFEGRTITGKSFIPGEAWDYDGSGHGTHVTGTAAGTINRETGLRYGVAGGAEILIGKVLSDAGSGSTSGIIDAIDWAIEKGARIACMSLGSPVAPGEAPSPVFEQVGRRALEANCLLIAASGNGSRRPGSTPRPVSSPANAQSIMAVAALDEQLNVAYFSNAGINANTGGRVDVSGPGVDVFSSHSSNANGQQYARLSGTSMAAPHVAGVAALLVEAFPDLSAAEIWLKLEKTAQQLADQSVQDVGSGLVQAPGVQNSIS